MPHAAFPSSRPAAGRAGLAAFALLLSALLSPLPTHALSAAEADEPPARAEEMIFGELPTVQGASRFDQPLTEAPASVTIVTAEQIRRFGYRTFADMLRGVRGFHTTYDRQYDFIGVRGFSPPGDFNGRILLLVDGHRTNDGIYHTAAIGTEAPIDIDLVERVEIIRGPGSSLYGNNAFFAVVNVITRDERSVGTAELSGEAHRYRGFQERATVGHRFGEGARILLSGTAWDRRGPDLRFPALDSPDPNGGLAAGVDGERSRSLFGRATYGSFSLRAAWNSREKDVPTGAYGTVFNRAGTVLTDERYFVDLRFERQADEATSVTARIFLDGYSFDGDYLYADETVNPDPPNLYVNRDIARNAAWGAELLATRQAGRRHKVTLGGEVRDDYRLRQQNFDAPPFHSQALDTGLRTFAWALFLQDEILLSDSWILNAGIRHDRFANADGSTSPRVSLIHNPRPGTTFKLLYGRAFRAPNAYERFYSSTAGIPQLSNPDLQPETIATYEAVWEQALGARFRLTVDGFHNRLSRLVSLRTVETDNALQMRNTGAMRTWGGEVELESDLESGVRGALSVSVQRTTDRETGQVPPNSPKAMVKGRVFVPLAGERLGAGVEASYTSGRKTLPGGRTGPVPLAALTLSSRDALPGLDLSASVYNLFGKRYSDPGSGIEPMESIPQDGRSYRIKATYGF